MTPEAFFTWTAIIIIGLAGGYMTTVWAVLAYLYSEEGNRTAGAGLSLGAAIFASLTIGAVWGLVQ